MPNWCANNAEISHENVEEIVKVVSAFKEGVLCETFLPIAHLPADQQYDAAINLWGTKWDVGDTTQGASVSEDGKTAYFTFESAWSPPIGLYEELTRLGFTVTANYFEPGGCFAGQYDSGVLEHFDFEPDTIDAVVPKELVEVYDIHDWYEAENEAPQ